MNRFEQDAQDLRVINSSMAALREIQKLPEQDEFSLLRAQAHTHAINTACHAIMARVTCEAAIEKARAA